MSGKPYDDNMAVPLLGRYYAILSVLPYLILGLVAFFGIAFIGVQLLFNDVSTSFEIVLLPFLLSTALGMPFLVIFLYMIRWHGKRRMIFDNTGLTMVLPGEKQVFVPWEFLLAVELRFQTPRMVVCTLVSGAIRFTFSTLELNLEGRVGLKNVYSAGFEMDKMRELLYYLHRKNRNLSWRITPDFKEQFNIKYPPYDLEKLK